MTVAKPSNLRLCKEMLIGGRAVPGEGKPLDVWNLATGRIMGSLQQASAAQVRSRPRSRPAGTPSTTALGGACRGPSVRSPCTG